MQPMLQRIPSITESLQLETISRKKIADKRIDAIYHRKSDDWLKINEERLLTLFNLSLKNISAYKEFLRDAGIFPKNIKELEDLKVIPPVSKTNYLRRYSWDKLIIPNSLTKESLVLTSTSGSTGAPFYFPRNGLLDAQSSIYHQMFVRSTQLDPNKSTLIIVCFGMGVWIGGVITYQAFKLISERGYPLTILTPGVNKKEIFSALKNIAPKYDQVILAGYPPFMKDIVDEAEEHDINWKKYNLRMIFAAEAFSETFRDYILKKTGMTNPYRSTMSVYGSADLGTMAEETPIAILIRRLALQKTDKAKRIYAKLFKDASRLPTLAQFIPDFINFETINGAVFISGDNVLPLFRYEIGDNGGTISFKEVENIFADEGIDLRTEAKKASIDDTIAELPFVYVYERTDFSTKLYGAIIYPEYIKEGIFHPTLRKHITGKFTMSTEHDEHQDEYLEINVELKPDSKESEFLVGEVIKRINESLIKKSAEHRNNVHMMGEKVTPRVIFWEHGHPTHFQTGIKQKWVKK